MENYKLTLSNTKIILSDNIDDLGTFKESIDYIIDTFVGNKEERNIKITLVDNVEADIFNTIIKPLVDYFMESLYYSETNSVYVPYFLLHVETTKQSYNEEQLLFLEENLVGLTQCFSDALSDEYRDLLMNVCPACNLKLIITPDNADHLFEIINGLTDFYHLCFDLDWIRCEDLDLSITKEQLDLYGKYITEAFDAYEVPLVSLNIDNAFCKLTIAYDAQSQGEYRTSPLSTWYYREGVGSLGDCTILNGNIYLNQCCLEDVFKIGSVYEDLDSAVVDTIVNTESYSCNLCDECYMQRICNNGNAGINYMLGQEFNVMNSVYCQWTSLMLSLAHDITTHFDAEQNNDLFKAYFTGATQRGVKLEY